MAIITLHNILFFEEEQDFETDSGYPVIISSINSPQVFDSYLMSGGNQIKLYKPTPTNITLSWDLKLLLDRNKFKVVQNLILLQTQLVKDYRINNDTVSMGGFLFRYESIDTKVWLSSFTNSGSFFSMGANKDLIRCKLSITETE